MRREWHELPGLHSRADSATPQQLPIRERRRLKPALRKCCTNEEENIQDPLVGIDSQMHSNTKEY